MLLLLVTLNLNLDTHIKSDLITSLNKFIFDSIEHDRQLNKIFKIKFNNVDILQLSLSLVPFLSLYSVIPSIPPFQHSFPISYSFFLQSSLSFSSFSFVLPYLSLSPPLFNFFSHSSLSPAQFPFPSTLQHRINHDINR